MSDSDTTEAEATAAQPLAGRRALVTGATSGIGRACAQRLAADGATVVVNHREHSADDADELVAELEAAGGRAIALVADVSDEAAVRKMFVDAAEQVGVIDLLVNNAGVEEQVELMDMSLDQWHTVIETNLTGPFLCSREAARGMVEAGVPGVIVNITSVHERIPWPGFSHYCASKGGLKLMSQTLARELATKGIRVVQVAPGAIVTPINKDVLEDEEKHAELIAQVPMARIGEAPEIAAAVSWMASDQASYVTGETLFVDGGMQLYPGVT
ncbi:MAG: gdh [Thermoleophilia bacterium]|nr:gdh [Thermoleophilia bacterium]